MKFLATIFWGSILGQVTYYLGASLSQETYNPIYALIASFVACLAVFAIQQFIPIKKASDDLEHSTKKGDQH